MQNFNWDIRYNVDPLSEWTPADMFPCRDLFKVPVAGYCNTVYENAIKEPTFIKLKDKGTKIDGFPREENMYDWHNSCPF